tara:strand:+ start:1218 stop:1985 length:768 start_codon:yes stop_codon:yes gene_type:complete
MKYDPKQRRSLGGVKAYNSETFLNSREARNIRIQCEITEPGIRLKRLGINHTIQFFGSARSKPTDDVYIQGHHLSHEIGKWLVSDETTDDIAIGSGGGPGLMEAVNRGAHEAGAPSVGMGISLPFEQENNEYVHPELDFEFHYFFTRKYWCVYLSKAYVALPGGIGTLDELFEVLTLIQTKKMPAVPIVLYGSEYWNTVVNFDRLVELGTISKDDLDRFIISDDSEEVINYLRDNITMDCLRDSGHPEPGTIFEF